MIEQITPTKLEINLHGVITSLTYLGINNWQLSFGKKTIKNIRLGKYKALHYSSFEKLEKEHPHWKGANMLFNVAESENLEIMH